MHAVYHGKGPPGHQTTFLPQSVGQLIELVVVVDNMCIVIALVSLQHAVRGPGVSGRPNEKPGGGLSNRGPVDRNSIGDIDRNTIDTMSISNSVVVNSLACMACGTRVTVVKARQPALLQVVEGVIEDDV